MHCDGRMFISNPSCALSAGRGAAGGEGLAAGPHPVLRLHAHQADAAEHAGAPLVAFTPLICNTKLRLGLLRFKAALAHWSVFS